MNPVAVQKEIDIPASEQWLYDNEEALEIVMKGMEDSAEGRIVKLNLDELSITSHP